MRMGKIDAKEIVWIRKCLGWSLTELARRLGTSSELVSIWEAGKSIPDPEAVAQLEFLRSGIEKNHKVLKMSPYVDEQIKKENIEQIYIDSSEDGDI